MQCAYPSHIFLMSKANISFMITSITMVADARHDAPWRTDRLGHYGFLAKQLARGAVITPIFSAPYVTTRTIRRDWLHSVDMGIAADFLGNLFKVFRDKLPGRTQADRVQVLWMRIQAFYETPPKVSDRLPKLQNSWIQAETTKPPKLKGNASCTRALIPFAHTLALELLDPTQPMEEAMITAAYHLHRCYTCLSKDTHGWQDILSQSSSAFAHQIGALAAASDGIHWRAKPKLHQFLELCASGGKPNLSWTYRDEDYGGGVAQQSRSRGGRLTPGVVSYNTLQRFKSQNPVPRLVGR